MKSFHSAGFKLRFLPAVVLLSGFLCCADAQTPSAGIASYPTLGNPTAALATPDAQYIFVSVTNVGGPNYSTPDSEAGKRHGVVSGLQVFRNAGGRLQSVGLIRLGSKGANGVTLLPGGKTLVVGVGDAGVAFVNVQDAIHGAAKPYFVAQGRSAGAYDVVSTPDGKYLFSANEYGHFQGQRGNVGILAVQSDAAGRVTHAQTIGHIPAGNKVPSLTISPDGARLYIAREILPTKGVSHFSGMSNPMLTKNDCVQRIGTPPRPNGLITVVDVKRAIASGSGQSAILSEVAAGCSPVRVIETRDASTLFVSARGDNRILTFSPHLLDSDPEHAFLRGFSSGGVAPVGIRLFAGERRLLVANSNRFVDSNGGVAILDVSRPEQPGIVETIPAGEFPRNVNLSPDGRFLYLTDYTSRTLEVIAVPPSLQIPEK
ncbi:MAG: beta-propeller fold lactonase family protein [Acidobacteriota bacterium]